MKTKNEISKGLQRRLVILLVVFVYSTTVTHAQYDDSKYMNVLKPVYFGYEVAVGNQYGKIQSNLPRLQGIRASNGGARVGIKMANHRGALRAHAGWYCASASAANSFDLLEVGATSHVYLLRTKEPVFHIIEPYALISLTYQRGQFYGAYPDPHNRKSDGAKLGSVDWINAGAGLGAEYQLENDNLQFMHFFAEARYGAAMLAHGSNSDFSQTRIKSPVTFVLGVSFGNFK